MMWVVVPSAYARENSYVMVCHRSQVADDEIYLVVNAGCREKDLAHIGKHLDNYKVWPWRLLPACTSSTPYKVLRRSALFIVLIFPSTTVCPSVVRGDTSSADCWKWAALFKFI